MEDDSGEGFGPGEAISAVQDEDAYLGEEDEDYDDLYNDVNVGENFLQTLRRDDDADFPREEEIQKKPVDLPPPPPPVGPASVSAAQPPPLLPPPPPPPAAAFSERPTLIPGIGGDSVGERGGDGSRGFSEVGFHGSGEMVVERGAPVTGFQSSMRVAPLPGQFPAAGFSGDGFMRQQGSAVGNVVVPSAVAGVNYNASLNGGPAGGGVVSSGTVLFVGDLHWWTTDADLEIELCKYGQVKELKFFDERASGKSKGYCQVEFFDPMAAAACKEGMNGHVFNGRACVVAFANPNTVRRMGEAQVSKTQVLSQTQAATAQGRGRVGGGVATGGNQGRGGGGNGAATGGGGTVGGGWGRSGGGMGGRGQVGGMRNRMGAAGGRGIMGNGGLVTPPPPPVLHPGTMLPQGFDPTGAYGAAMGRMAGAYAGFPGGPGGPPFPGMLPSFPPVVAPHVNPAFFGRGMPPGGMGMWSDPNVASWGGEEQSSYGEEAVSDQQYGEVSHVKDRSSDRRHRDEREKDEGAGSEWSERRHHDERDAGRERDRDRDRERDRERERERDREREKDRDRERDRHRDDRDRHGDHSRHRDDDWERSRSSRTRSRSRERDHSKRRRTSPR